MKQFAILFAFGAALAATPALAQTVVVQGYAGPGPYYDSDYGWGGPYAYAPRPRYVYEYDRGAVVYPGDAYAYGPYWQNCTQSKTPTRTDRTAASANVTDRCY